MKGMMIYIDNCRFCNASVRIALPTAGFYNWQNGALIQNAMPEVSADAREFLISGICPECQKAIFGE
jgi:hypothetical protein